jgi:hypothetical protein
LEQEQVAQAKPENKELFFHDEVSEFEIDNLRNNLRMTSARENLSERNSTLNFHLSFASNPRIEVRVNPKMKPIGVCKSISRIDLDQGNKFVSDAGNLQFRRPM